MENDNNDDLLKTKNKPTRITDNDELQPRFDVPSRMTITRDIHFL